MKRNIFSILFTSLLLIGFMASCNMQPGNFTLSIKNYDPFTDTARVVVANDNSNCQVRGAECYWTFDGSEPNDMQSKNTNVETLGGADEEFDITIPSDFYSGKIKFLCKITYSMMGKKDTVTKKFSKSYTVDYHKAPSSDLTLAKNKGYVKNYYIPTSNISITNTITYTTSENGNVVFTCLLGDGQLSFYPAVSENMNPVETTENGNQITTYENVPSGTEFKVHYENGTWGTTSVKDAEYKIILK